MVKLMSVLTEIQDFYLKFIKGVRLTILKKLKLLKKKGNLGTSGQPLIQARCRHNLWFYK